MFLNFLQKYRCVPKIGFSADISIDIFIDISIDILIGICVDVLIDRGREEEGRSEGVDLFLKSNSPTPTGGEKQNLTQGMRKNEKRTTPGRNWRIIRLFPFQSSSEAGLPQSPLKIVLTYDQGGLDRIFVYMFVLMSV